jgi:hypothetical protein
MPMAVRASEGIRNSEGIPLFEKNKSIELRWVFRAIASSSTVIKGTAPELLTMHCRCAVLEELA